VGLDSPDDCAVVAPEPTLASVHTVDFFRSFIDDPYVFGIIAANHALSDCHAMCAEARTALAIAVVPYAVESKVEESLFQMMAGACSALAESGCALVGGHSCEGTELALGFCINGAVEQDRALRKGGMTPGDCVVLTKAIGTGTLFAADMRMKAKVGLYDTTRRHNQLHISLLVSFFFFIRVLHFPETTLLGTAARPTHPLTCQAPMPQPAATSHAQGAWITEAIASMCQSNREAALCLRRHGATSCTDVTGFGLLGHLQEMVQASPGAGVELKLDDVPELTGARECTQAGVFSSLQPANLRLKRAVANEAEALSHPTYPLLFDPQTAGGLLATVPADQADACIQELRALGYARATVVGRVTMTTTSSTGASSGAAAESVDDPDNINACALPTLGRIHCVV
jgi:selenide,water dikinase